METSEFFRFWLICGEFWPICKSQGRRLLILRGNKVLRNAIAKVLAYSKWNVEALSKYLYGKFGNVYHSLCLSLWNVYHFYDTVQSAFAVNNLSVLKECWADLLREIDAISESSIEQLLGAMSSTDHSLSRNISVEIYIPKSVRDQKNKSCTAR